MVPYKSIPMLDSVTQLPVGWDVGAHEEVATASSWSIRASVLCSDEPTVAVRAYIDFVSEQYRSLDLFCPSGWITTGGGATVSGAIRDWLTISNPSSSLRYWDTWFQRPEAETGDTDLDFYAVCPEPGALASGLLVLAALASQRRRKRHA